MGEMPRPHANVEPSPAQVVEHADLLDQAQRIIGGQNVNQGAETDARRALGRGRQKKARRRRHVQRRAVMLGDVVAIKALLFGAFDQLQALLVKLGQR